ncbi:MAG: alpha/beta hydrolase fold domain-containing protein [Caulobacteraceae bacterium]
MQTSKIDPEVRGFIEGLQAEWKRYPALDTVPVTEARRIADAVRAPLTRGGPTMRKTEEHTVATAVGALRVRVYYPQTAPETKAPALVYMHGGGFVLFSLDTHDRLMREYAHQAGVAVVGVDYPLSPEAKYPAALNHVEALVLWLRDGGAVELGLDIARLALGGDSAGANLSVAACLKLRDRGEGRLVRAILSNYGGFSSICSDESEAQFGGPGSVMDREEVNYFWRQYLADPSQQNDPLACPLLADLHDLPPVFLIVPELDIVTEHSLAMHERLLAAGVPTEMKIYPGATHSFLEAMSVSRLAREAIADGAAYVKRMLA